MAVRLRDTTPNSCDISCWLLMVCMAAQQMSIAPLLSSMFSCLIEASTLMNICAYRDFTLAGVSMVWQIMSSDSKMRTMCFLTEQLIWWETPHLKKVSSSPCNWTEFIELWYWLIDFLMQFLKQIAIVYFMFSIIKVLNTNSEKFTYFHIISV